MSRSLKKGPFADEHLLKKIDELNKNNVAQQSFLNLFLIQ